MKRTKESSNLRIKSNNTKIKKNIVVKINLKDDVNNIQQKRRRLPIYFPEQVPEELKRLIETDIWKEQPK